MGMSVEVLVFVPIGDLYKRQGCADRSTEGRAGRSDRPAHVPADRTGRYRYYAGNADSAQARHEQADPGKHGVQCTGKGADALSLIHIFFAATAAISSSSCFKSGGVVRLDRRTREQASSITSIALSGR